MGMFRQGGGARGLVILTHLYKDTIQKLKTWNVTPLHTLELAPSRGDFAFQPRFPRRHFNLPRAIAPLAIAPNDASDLLRPRGKHR